MTDNKFYLDHFLMELYYSLREISLSQRNAVDRLKRLMRETMPEDAEIVTSISRAIDVGLDSPKRFCIFVNQAIEKVEKNKSIAKVEKYA